MAGEYSREPSVKVWAGQRRLIEMGPSRRETPARFILGVSPGTRGFMRTGELRNQIDRIWDSFWSGGIANPIEVIEQITYLLFLKRLDDEQTREDKKALTLNKPVERHIFPEGSDADGTPYRQMRWQNFKNLEPRAMFDLVDRHVFPFLRAMGGDGSTYAHHMRDARFTIPTRGRSTPRSGSPRPDRPGRPGTPTTTRWPKPP